MRKLLSIISLIFIINPVYSCPIDVQDKDQTLSELCNIDDGKWSSNRLNEMIILNNFESLPSKLTEKNTIVDKQILSDQNQKLNKLIQK